jgi:hypothetical protein
MTGLSTKPRSSTKKQHRTLVPTGRRCGLDLAEVRRLAGGSITELSAHQASVLISRLTGRDLPNPPGRKPKAYQGKPAPGATRMITADHVAQIKRLGWEYFKSYTAFALWLERDFKLKPYSGDTIESTITQLATAQRAGEVIRTLKQMLERKGSRDQERLTAES